MTEVDSEWFLFSVRSDNTSPEITLNIAAGLSGQKFETSKVCICTQNHPSAKKSSFFVPWEAGGPSPNQHASATPPLLNAWLQELSNSKEVKFVRMVFLINDWGELRVVPHR